MGGGLPPNFLGGICKIFEIETGMHPAVEFPVEKLIYSDTGIVVTPNGKMNRPQKLSSSAITSRAKAGISIAQHLEEHPSRSALVHLRGDAWGGRGRCGAGAREQQEGHCR